MSRQIGKFQILMTTLCKALLEGKPVAVCGQNGLESRVREELSRRGISDSKVTFLYPDRDMRGSLKAFREVADENRRIREVLEGENAFGELTPIPHPGFTEEEYWKLVNKISAIPAELLGYPLTPDQAFPPS